MAQILSVELDTDEQYGRRGMLVVIDANVIMKDPILREHKW